MSNISDNVRNFNGSHTSNWTICLFLHQWDREFCQFLMQELSPFSAILQEKVLNSRNALHEKNSTDITTFDRKNEDTLKSQAYGSTLLLSPKCLPAASVIRSNINIHDQLMIPCAGLSLKKSLQSPVSVADTEPFANPIHMANSDKPFPLGARNVDEAMLFLPAIEHFNSSSPRQDEAQSVNLTPWEQKWRLLPESCAICLDEFQDKEKVSWSSNPRCFHVFHQECIYDWLVMNQKENQRKPMKIKREKSLLSCPCCRQSFVSSRIISDE